MTIGQINTALLGSQGPGRTTGLVLPAGVSGKPGLGLALHGGVGYLTRLFGLTVDHLQRCTLVTGNGLVWKLSGANAMRSKQHAELWWAVRGAASIIGVVVEAVFVARQLPLGEIWIDRLVQRLSSTSNGIVYFCVHGSVCDTTFVSPPRHAMADAAATITHE